MCGFVREHMHTRGYAGAFRDSKHEAYLCNLRKLTPGRCDCVLVSAALFIGEFSMIPLCEFSPFKSPTIGPR